jgi:hypothetical protein
MSSPDYAGVSMLVANGDRPFPFSTPNKQRNGSIPVVGGGVDIVVGGGVDPVVGGGVQLVGGGVDLV